MNNKEIEKLILSGCDNNELAHYLECKVYQVKNELKKRGIDRSSLFRHNPRKGESKRSNYFDDPDNLVDISTNQDSEFFSIYGVSDIDDLLDDLYGGSD